MNENNFLPALPPPAENQSQRYLPVPFETYRAPGMFPEMEPAPASVPLSHYLWIFRRNWWKIVLFVACSVAARVVCSARLTTIIEYYVTVDDLSQLPCDM